MLALDMDIGLRLRMGLRSEIGDEDGEGVGDGAQNGTKRNGTTRIVCDGDKNHSMLQTAQSGQVEYVMVVVAVALAVCKSFDSCVEA